jgi:thiamine-phosphate pyrophosphorylase
MDRKLVAWARAVKSSRAGELLYKGLRSRDPVLWLFTDAQRLADPRAAVARLPKGLCGVVLRHDCDPGRAALGRDLARICRARRLELVVAGDTRLALELSAGVHLRAGRWPDVLRPRRGLPRTSSAHDGAELHRARRAGAGPIFLSPVFPTPSHPGRAALGLMRWLRLARQADRTAALGGIRGTNVARLPGRFCYAIGAISALT